MDLISTISPYEYIGNSLGKINQNFINLQKLPVTLSAKYIQIDNFITSLRGQIVTDSLQVSGNASVKEIFKAEGDVFLGSNERSGEKVTIYSWPIYLPNAINSSQSLVFGRETIGSVLVNLYRTTIGSRADVLQTDGDFRVVNNFTVGGNLWLSGDAWIGDTNTDSINVKSGNIYLDNFTSSSQAITFGTTNTPKLYRVSNNTLEIDGTLEITTNLIVDGNTTLGNANTDVVTVNGIAAAEDNTVVVLDSSNRLKTDEIDSRVWGNSLVDGSGTSNKVAKWSDADTITDSNIIDNGTTITLDGRLTVKSGVVAGTATLASGTVTVTTAAAATNSIVLVTLRASGGTVTTTWQYRATPGTGNFTITALTNAGATNASDTSTLSWMLVNVA